MNLDGGAESNEFISTIHLRFKIYLDGFFTSDIQLPYPHIQDISSNSTCIFNYRYTVYTLPTYTRYQFKFYMYIQLKFIIDGIMFMTDF